MMKALTFILAFSSFSLAVTAQELKINLEKTTDKYGLKLKKTRVIQQDPSQNIWGAKPNRVLVMPDSNVLNSLTLPRTREDMPRLVPDTRNIVPIPNALSRFEEPAVAAIPNPLRNKQNLLNSSPSK